MSKCLFGTTLSLRCPLHIFVKRKKNLATSRRKMSKKRQSNSWYSSPTNNHRPDQTIFSHYHHKPPLSLVRSSHWELGTSHTLNCFAIRVAFLLMLLFIVKLRIIHNCEPGFQPTILCFRGPPRIFGHYQYGITVQPFILIELKPNHWRHGRPQTR